MTVTVLLNSAMMPAEGHQRGELASYIGYPETAAHISRIAGVPIPVCRDATQLHGPSALLICKLSYRLNDPATKGKVQPADSDYEYYICQFTPFS